MSQMTKPEASGTAGADQSTKEKVQDTAQQVQQQVGEKAQEVKGQAGDRVRTELDTRSTQAGEQVTATASALRKMGEQLRGEEQATPAKFAEQAATQADRLGRYLTEANADRMLQDVERFGRRQPWLAAAGGVVARVHGVEVPQGLEQPAPRAVGLERARRDAVPVDAAAQRRGKRGCTVQPLTRKSARRRSSRDESTAALVRRLADETTTLVKQELEHAREEASRAGEAVVTLAKQELSLAKAEMAEKAGKAGPGIGMIGAAGGVGLLAAGTLTAFIILALDGVMANWLAALIVGLVYAAIAAGLYFAGKGRIADAGPLVPEQTVETVKEDIEWAKTQLGSSKR